VAAEVVTVILNATLYFTQTEDSLRFCLKAQLLKTRLLFVQLCPCEHSKAFPHASVSHSGICCTKCGQMGVLKARVGSYFVWKSCSYVVLESMGQLVGFMWIGDMQVKRCRSWPRTRTFLCFDGHCGRLKRKCYWELLTFPTLLNVSFLSITT